MRMLFDSAAAFLSHYTYPFVVARFLSVLWHRKRIWHTHGHVVCREERRVGKGLLHGDRGIGEAPSVTAK